jgi:hypothetical protein
MKTKSFAAAMFVAALLIAGCEPINSLFALYTNDDKVFEENLIGEWKEVSEPGNSVQEDLRWVFYRDGDSFAYKTSLISLEKKGGFLSKGRLVQLGNFQFIDFEADETSVDSGDAAVPFPFLVSHMFGRIWIEKNTVRIHFLNDDWVKEQLKNGKLDLAHAGPPDNPVLNATTEELRKFSLERAEDKEAFSENYRLERVK